MSGKESNVRLSGLYAIADRDVLAARGVPLKAFAESLRVAAVRAVQWRCKNGLPREVLDGASVLSETFAGSWARLIMNDRVDLALLAGFDGVHVGQNDLAPADVRRIACMQVYSGGPGPTFIVGVSTHADEEVQQADQGEADYVAVGPIFATGTKLDAAPVVGLDGLRRARVLTNKPLVAIGGITRENAASVRAAGADAVAVISGLFVPGETVEKVARDFLAIFR